MAAGLTLPLEHLQAFTTEFQTVIAGHDDALFHAVLLTDGELSADDFSLQTAQAIAQAGPWGQGFPSPVFEGQFEVLEYRWLQEQHLRLKLKNPHSPALEAIAFKMADQISQDQPIKRVHLAYQLDINEFRGQKRLQLMVQQLQIVA